MSIWLDGEQVLIGADNRLVAILVVAKDCNLALTFRLGILFQFFLKLHQRLEGHFDKHDLDLFSHRDLQFENFAQKHRKNLLSEVADYHAAILSRYTGELDDQALGFSE